MIYLEPEHRPFTLLFAKELRRPGGCTLTAEGYEPVIIKGGIAAYLARIFEGLGNGQVAVFHDKGKPPSFAGKRRTHAKRRNRSA